MDFEVKNLSDVSLGIANGGDYRNSLGRPESFDVKVLDSKGNAVIEPKAGMSFGGLSGFLVCKSGQSINIRLYLPHWAIIEEPGEYQIQIHKSVIARKYDRAYEYFEESGVPVSVSGKIVVQPFDYKKMGVIVDTIGKKLVEQDETAGQLVPFVTDDRIITYLSQAINKNASLIRSLAKFNDDRALNSILSRLDDKDSEVRRNVSRALVLSVHPRSKSYLLGMRTDTNVGIRLDIVQYLGTINTEASTRILKEMMNDQNQEWIGKEARRFLRERGERID